MKWLEKATSGSSAARSCWAIDIGTTGARAVLLRRRGRSAKLADWREAVWSREEAAPPTPEQIRRGLAELTAGRKLTAETVVSAIPIHQVFIKILTVPFTRTSQIRQVIAAEAELHIPHPLEEVVLDFWPLEYLPGDKTRVMTVAVKKDVLSAHLEALASAGIDPDMVGIDFLGLAAGLNRTGELAAEEEVMLAEVGARHTACAFFRRGRINFLRGFAWGTDSVTRALMKAGGLGFADAEHLRAEALSSAPPGEWAVEALNEAREELAGELSRTLIAASGRASGDGPSRLILAADGIPGLPKFLSRRLGIEIVPPPPFRGIRAGKARRDFPPSVRSALGLALGRLKPTDQEINFRRGEFSGASAGRTIRRRLWLAAAQAAALAAVVLALLLGRISAEERRARQLQAEIHAILEQTATHPAQVPAGLERYHMEEKLKQAERRVRIYRRLEALSALDILREISRVLPPEIPIQVVELDIAPDRVRFQGRTDSYGSAEAVRRALAASPYFKEEIDAGRMRTRRRGGELVTVEFNYLIPVSGPES